MRHFLVRKDLNGEMKEVIFLDRDGTLINDPGHLYKKDDVKLLPGIESLITLQDKGYILLIVTNQSTVARGIISENEMMELGDFIENLLSEKGVQITKSYYCPHHPKFTAECDCRKPKPGLFLEAIKEFDVDLEKSFVIGDKPGDLLAGRRAGVKFGILLKRNQKEWDATEDELANTMYKTNNISEAVKMIAERL